MVDFNSDSTVATPPGEVVKILVLERREQVIEALESYHRSEADHLDVAHKNSLLRARVMALWYELDAMVERRLAKAPGTEEQPTYRMVADGVEAARTTQDLISVFKWLNKFIDDLGLTYIDGRARYDRTRVEQTNAIKGL